MRVGRMLLIATTGCLIPLFGAWTDPSDDLLDEMASPAFDLLEIRVTVHYSEIRFDLTFNPAKATLEELEGLSGFIDLDVDDNPSTGRFAHLAEYDLSPVPDIGADYYLGLYPGGFAELVQVQDGSETTIDYYPITVNGMTASLSVPRCEPGQSTGLAMGASYSMVVLIGNEYAEMTDRAPEGDQPFRGRPGDFDNNDLVNDDDLQFLGNCTTGATVLLTGPNCEPADLDEDGDVDQDDFGILQLNWTG